MAPGSSRTRSLRKAYSTLAGVTVVLVTSWFAFHLHLNFAAAGFIQLFIVLVVALKSGFGPATLTSLAANVSLNFFFVPPVFSFTINDPENWVALLIFECSALVVSRLSDRAQEQTRRAQQHEHELEGLYEVSRELLLLDLVDRPGLQVLRSLQRIFSLDSLVLWDSRQGTLDTLGDATGAQKASTREADMLQRDGQDTAAGLWVRVLKVGGRSFGALTLQGRSITAPVANALASLTAITLERAHLFESHGRAEAEKQTEQLRTTVLDALAHEYKTPLTVMRTVTSGLLEGGTLSAQQAELLGLMDLEVIRLNEITTRLLQMSRLDKTDIHIRRDRISLDSLFETILASATRTLAGHSIQTSSPAEEITVRGDRELLTIALTQFLDNAAKYSDPGSPITIAAKATLGEAHISVHNFGPEIPLLERERIFQRFYRGSGSSYRAPGTGLGLWISKRVASMHGGRVWVASHNSEGNTFTFALPLN